MNQATPEQQAQYDKFVENGMRLIYDKKGLPQILKALDGDGDPVSGLATVVGAATMRLAQSAQKAGKPLPPEVILYGAGELMEQLADFSDKSGGHKYSDEELKVVAKAMVGNGQQAPQSPAQLQPPQAAQQAAQPPQSGQLMEAP
jgi:hypothetical protein